MPGESGGRETYARELLPALRAAAPGLRVTAFLNRECAGDGWWREATDRAVLLPGASGRARARWAAGELLLLPRAAADVDVVHSVANFGPLHGRFARVLTVHDVGYRTAPETVPAPVRWATHALVKPAARRADRVITVSHAAAADIERELAVPRGRIDVIPNGIRTPRAGGGAGHALSIATDLPHKNLDLLADAARRAGVELVIAGHGTERLPGGRGRVEDLSPLWAAAGVYVTTTLQEGFGLPVAEALAAGVPVVCSDLPVLREVAGDCAEYVDPRDADAVAAGLRRVLAGGAEIERRVADGRARAARFTWEAAARATLASYRTALAQPPRTPERPARASR